MGRSGHWHKWDLVYRSRPCGEYALQCWGNGSSNVELRLWGPPCFIKYSKHQLLELERGGIWGYSLRPGWLRDGEEDWGVDEDWLDSGVDVQPCRDMKSPMNRSTSDLNPSRRVLSRAVFIGGGFSMDVSRYDKRCSACCRRRCWLVDHCFPTLCFFCFCSRVLGEQL